MPLPLNPALVPSYVTFIERYHTLCTDLQAGRSSSSIIQPASAVGADHSQPRPSPIGGAAAAGHGTDNADANGPTPGNLEDAVLDFVRKASERQLERAQSRRSHTSQHSSHSGNSGEGSAGGGGHGHGDSSHHAGTNSGHSGLAHRGLPPRPSSRASNAHADTAAVPPMPTPALAPQQPPASTASPSAAGAGVGSLAPPFQPPKQQQPATSRATTSSNKPAVIAAAANNDDDDENGMGVLSSGLPSEEEEGEDEAAVEAVVAVGTPAAAASAVAVPVAAEQVADKDNGQQRPDGEQSAAAANAGSQEASSADDDEDGEDDDGWKTPPKASTSAPSASSLPSAFSSAAAASASASSSGSENATIAARASTAAPSPLPSPSSAPTAGPASTAADKAPVIDHRYTLPTEGDDTTIVGGSVLARLFGKHKQGQAQDGTGSGAGEGVAASSSTAASESANASEVGADSQSQSVRVHAEADSLEADHQSNASSANDSIAAAVSSKVNSASVVGTHGVTVDTDATDAVTARDASSKAAANPKRVASAAAVAGHLPHSKPPVVPSSAGTGNGTSSSSAASTVSRGRKTAPSAAVALTTVTASTCATTTSKKTVDRSFNPAVKRGRRTNSINVDGSSASAGDGGGSSGGAHAGNSAKSNGKSGGNGHGVSVTIRQVTAASGAAVVAAPTPPRRAARQSSTDAAAGKRSNMKSASPSPAHRHKSAEIAPGTRRRTNAAASSMGGAGGKSSTSYDSAGSLIWLPGHVDLHVRYGTDDNAYASIVSTVGAAGVAAAAAAATNGPWAINTTSQLPLCAAVENAARRVLSAGALNGAAANGYGRMLTGLTGDKSTPRLCDGGGLLQLIGVSIKAVDKALSSELAAVTSSWTNDYMLDLDVVIVGPAFGIDFGPSAIAGTSTTTSASTMATGAANPKVGATSHMGHVPGSGNLPPHRRSVSGATSSGTAGGRGGHAAAAGSASTGAEHVSPLAIRALSKQNPFRSLGLLRTGDALIAIDGLPLSTLSFDAALEKCRRAAIRASPAEPHIFTFRVALASAARCRLIGLAERRHLITDTLVKRQLPAGASGLDRMDIGHGMHDDRLAASINSGIVPSASPAIATGLNASGGGAPAGNESEPPSSAAPGDRNDPALATAAVAASSSATASRPRYNPSSKVTHGIDSSSVDLGSTKLSTAAVDQAEVDYRKLVRKGQGMPGSRATTSAAAGSAGVIATESDSSAYDVSCNNNGSSRRGSDHSAANGAPDDRAPAPPPASLPKLLKQVDDASIVGTASTSTGQPNVPAAIANVIASTSARTRAPAPAPGKSTATTAPAKAAGISSVPGYVDAGVEVKGDLASFAVASLRSSLGSSLDASLRATARTMTTSARRNSLSSSTGGGNGAQTTSKPQLQMMMQSSTGAFAAGGSINGNDYNNTAIGLLPPMEGSIFEPTQLLSADGCTIAQMRKMRGGYVIETTVSNRPLGVKMSQDRIGSLLVLSVDSDGPMSGLLRSGDVVVRIGIHDVSIPASGITAHGLSSHRSAANLFHSQSLVAAAAAASQQQQNNQSTLQLLRSVTGLTAGASASSSTSDVELCMIRDSFRVPAGAGGSAGNGYGSASAAAAALASGGPTTDRPSMALGNKLTLGGGSGSSSSAAAAQGISATNYHSSGITRGRGTGIGSRSSGLTNVAIAYGHNVSAAAGGSMAAHRMGMSMGYTRSLSASGGRATTSSTPTASQRGPYQDAAASIQLMQDSVAKLSVSNPLTLRFFRAVSSHNVDEHAQLVSAASVRYKRASSLNSNNGCAFAHSLSRSTTGVGAAASSASPAKGSTSVADHAAAGLGGFKPNVPATKASASPAKNAGMLGFAVTKTPAEAVSKLALPAMAALAAVPSANTAPASSGQLKSDIDAGWSTPSTAGAGDGKSNGNQQRAFTVNGSSMGAAAAAPSSPAAPAGLRSPTFPELQINAATANAEPATSSFSATAAVPQAHHSGHATASTATPRVPTPRPGDGLPASALTPRDILKRAVSMSSSSNGAVGASVPMHRASSNSSLGIAASGSSGASTGVSGTSLTSPTQATANSISFDQQQPHSQHLQSASSQAAGVAGDSASRTACNSNQTIVFGEGGATTAPAAGSSMRSDDCGVDAAPLSDFISTSTSEGSAGSSGGGDSQLPLVVGMASHGIGGAGSMPSSTVFGRPSRSGANGSNSHGISCSSDSGGGGMGMLGNLTPLQEETASQIALMLSGASGKSGVHSMHSHTHTSPGSAAEGDDQNHNHVQQQQAQGGAATPVDAHAHAHASARRNSSLARIASANSLKQRICRGGSVGGSGDLVDVATAAAGADALPIVMTNGPSVTSPMVGDGFPDHTDGDNGSGAGTGGGGGIRRSSALSPSTAGGTTGSSGEHVNSGPVSSPAAATSRAPPFASSVPSSSNANRSSSHSITPVPTVIVPDGGARALTTSSAAANTLSPGLLNYNGSSNANEPMNSLALSTPGITAISAVSTATGVVSPPPSSVLSAGGSGGGGHSSVGTQNSNNSNSGPSSAVSGSSFTTNATSKSGATAVSAASDADGGGATKPKKKGLWGSIKRMLGVKSKKGKGSSAADVNAAAPNADVAVAHGAPGGDAGPASAAAAPGSRPAETVSTSELVSRHSRKSGSNSRFSIPTAPVPAATTGATPRTPSATGAADGKMTSDPSTGAGPGDNGDGYVSGNGQADEGSLVKQVVLSASGVPTSRPIETEGPLSPHESNKSRRHERRFSSNSHAAGAASNPSGAANGAGTGLATNTSAAGGHGRDSASADHRDHDNAAAPAPSPVEIDETGQPRAHSSNAPGAHAGTDDVASAPEPQQQQQQQEKQRRNSTAMTSLVRDATCAGRLSKQLVLQFVGREGGYGLRFVDAPLRMAMMAAGTAGGTAAGSLLATGGSTSYTAADAAAAIAASGLQFSGGAGPAAIGPGSIREFDINMIDPNAMGVFVHKVKRGGFAAQHLRQGDRLIAIDGKSVTGAPLPNEQQQQQQKEKKADSANGNDGGGAADGAPSSTSDTLPVSALRMTASEVMAVLASSDMQPRDSLPHSLTFLRPVHMRMGGVMVSSSRSLQVSSASVPTPAAAAGRAGDQASSVTSAAVNEQAVTRRPSQDSATTSTSHGANLGNYKGESGVIGKQHSGSKD